MLLALGGAALRRGAPVLFVDHHKPTLRSAKMQARVLMSIARVLKLKMDCIVKGNLVYVWSNHPRLAEFD